jgi:dolichol-phosphate mannosyltransferase
MPLSSNTLNIQPRVLVALCTYNEFENIQDLTIEISNRMPDADILIVDDDSPDGTGAWAAAKSDAVPNFHAIVRKDQRGLGGAIQAAIQFAMNGDYEWLLNLDADFSHSPNDLPGLLEKANHPQTPLDCVVGTRYAENGDIVGWPTHRRLMSKMVNRFATGILRLPVSDCSGSLRCYRVEALRGIDPDSLRSNGYAIFEELLVRLRRSGARFGEVPITFHERRSGISKLTIAEATKAAWQIIKLAAS